MRRFTSKLAVSVSVMALGLAAPGAAFAGNAFHPDEGDSAPLCNQSGDGITVNAVQACGNNTDVNVNVG